MRNLENDLKNKAINTQKLLEYGFLLEGEKYQYKKKLKNNQFEVIVEVKNQTMTSKIIDLDNKDEYVLADIPDSVGEFVGKIKEEYEIILQDIIKNCTEVSVFKNTQSRQIIKYIYEKYNDELEFLWEKFDNNAIWRNKKNNKWYAVLMIVSESKLGLNSDEKIEVMDLRYPKGKTIDVIDNKNILPGYHMNKNSWITIKLNNSIDLKRIYQLIDKSYQLSVGNKCRINEK